MIALMNKVFDCPDCGHAQSTFALRTTLRGALHIPTNAYLACPNCGAHLALRAKSSAGTLWLARVATSLALAGCFLVLTRFVGLSAVLIMLFLHVIFVRTAGRHFYQTFYKVVRV